MQEDKQSAEAKRLHHVQSSKLQEKLIQKRQRKEQELKSNEQREMQQLVEKQQREKDEKERLRVAKQSWTEKVKEVGSMRFSRDFIFDCNELNTSGHAAC